MYNTEIMKKYTAGENSIVMTRKQVRAFDSWAINTLGIPGVVLMENAGRSCAEFIADKLADISEPYVCIFCGTGNNGGDGYVIARHLADKDFKVTVLIAGDRNKVKGDAKINLDILEQTGQSVECLQVGRADIGQRLKEVAGRADLIVDALFGTGLKGELNSAYKQLIEHINVLDRTVLAVDIPSGLDCDTGQPLGAAVRAGYTMTFVAVKAGFAEATDAKQYTGEIFVASIGIEPANRSWQNQIN